MVMPVSLSPALQGIMGRIANARRGYGAGSVGQLQAAPAPVAPSLLGTLGAAAYPELGSVDAAAGLAARGTSYGILAITGGAAGVFTGSVAATWGISAGSRLFLSPRGAITAALVSVSIEGAGLQVNFAGAQLPGPFVDITSFLATGFLLAQDIPTSAVITVGVDISGAGTVDVVVVTQSRDSLNALAAWRRGCGPLRG